MCISTLNSKYKIWVLFIDDTHCPTTNYKSKFLYTQWIYSFIFLSLFFRNLKSNFPLFSLCWSSLTRKPSIPAMPTPIDLFERSSNGGQKRNHLIQVLFQILTLNRFNHEDNKKCLWVLKILFFYTTIDYSLLPPTPVSNHMGVRRGALAPGKFLPMSNH
jgi:hypothetical protein